jgi:cytochrome c-type biogenesis protein
MEPTFGLAIAFTAGLLSFLSPCVLPLIPSYVTFITGMGFEDVTRARQATLVHALLFVFGFSLIFVGLGIGATALGTLLLAYRDWISRIGGVLVIVFGLYMLGVLRIGAMAKDTRVHLADKPVGYLGTVLVGIAFGAGWTPCIGPILGAILTYAGTSDDFGRSAGLLGAYSAGLAIPFLGSAVAIERFLGAFQRFRKHMGTVNKVSGVLLILVGVLMLTNWFTVLAGWLDGLTPDFLRDRL